MTPGRWIAENKEVHKGRKRLGGVSWREQVGYVDGRRWMGLRLSAGMSVTRIVTRIATRIAAWVWLHTRQLRQCTPHLRRPGQRVGEHKRNAENGSGVRFHQVLLIWLVFSSLCGVAVWREIGWLPEPWDCTLG